MQPPIRSREDILALEERPLAECLPAGNVYDAFLKGAAIDPDKPAMHVLVEGAPEEEPETISYRALVERVNRTANMLHELGLRPGETVSFLLPLCPEALSLIIGGAAAGIVNAVNPLLESWQIAEILKAAGTKVLVTTGPGHEYWEKVAEIQGQLPDLAAVLQVGPGAGRDGALSFDEELAKQPGDRLVSGRHIAGADIAAYFHTGGTTGTPKLVRHTHLMQVSHVWSTGVVLGWDERDVILVGLPLFHIGGSVVGTIIPLCRGATLVVGSPNGFRDANLVRAYWRLVHRYRVTIIAAVPTVLGALLNIPLENADIGTVRYTLTGGASFPIEVGKAFYEFTDRMVLEGYGMTEAASYVTMIPRDGPLRLGSVGVPLPHVEVRTAQLDADGKLDRFCGTDEIGVVLVRGDCVMPGYVEDRHNQGVWPGEGWFNTGDLGRFDRDGYLWITGRAKDLIIRGGHNIDPAVIEETMHKHPAVELAAAVGKPDAYAGELPICYVQLRPEAAAEPAELQAFVRERIPERAANPVNVFLVDAMPVTGVGKIFKPALRQDAVARVYGELVQAIAEAAGITAEVSVDAHDLHGTLATVALTGGATDERAVIEAEIGQALAPFAVRHEVVWR